MELIRKSDALHAVLHNTGDAAVAAVQAIKPINPHGELREMLIDELKPCPFCGSESGKLFIETDEIGWHFVICAPSDGGCGATGPGGVDADHAAELWNRRANGARICAKRNCTRSSVARTYGTQK